MLISQVRTEIVTAGLDPSIGFAHRRSWNPIPLAYDLMEPIRPVVDRKVSELALSHTFTPGDFAISSKGGVPDCTLITSVTAKGNIALFEWQGYCGIGRKQALASHHGAVKAAAAGYNFRLLI